MKQLKSRASDLRRLFEEGISAAYIAEPFISFDELAEATVVLDFMTAQDYDVVGVRQHGLPVGYVVRSALSDGTLAHSMRIFDDAECLTERGSLLKAFEIVREQDRVFITFAGSVAGIITRGDLQKVPVRMWLFNLISLLEMHMLRLVRERYPSGEWRELIPLSRVVAAATILEERRGKNEATDLADCLQFADKQRILLRCADLCGLFGESIKSANKFLKQVQRLRDELAHSQDIITGNWPSLVDLAAKIEGVLVKAEATYGLPEHHIEAATGCKVVVGEMANRLAAVVEAVGKEGTAKK